MTRTLLSRTSGIATRQRVYRIPDGLEVDEVDHFEVRRWRVLYEDVILTTYHRYRGVTFLIVTGAFAALFAVASWAAGRTEASAGWIMAAILVVPFLLAFILRLLLGVDEINVYSQRSQARMRFNFRKGRARELFDEIVEGVRGRQGSSLRSE
jgi:hypothetical protein